MNFEELSNNPQYVVPSYLTAFLFTAILTNHDYISKSWKTVRRTRWFGKFHSLVSCFSIVIISIYVFVQAKSNDYKEMSTGIVAILIIAIHFARTFLGLWQLHCFSHWAKKGIGKFNTVNINAKSEYDVDEIHVNETIIENKLIDGDIKFRIRFLSPKRMENINNCQNWFCKFLFLILELLRILPSVIQLFLSVVIFSNQSFVNNSDAPFLEHEEPEEAWIKWAACFLANCYPEFIGTDNCEKNSHRNKKFEEFQKNLMLYCALQVQNETGPGKTFIANGLSNRYFDVLSKGLFEKEDFLEIAKNSGHGLPFGQSHKEDYNKYRYRLRKFIDELHPNIWETAFQMRIEDIEWATIVFDLNEKHSSTSEDASFPGIFNFRKLRESIRLIFKLNRSSLQSEKEAAITPELETRKEIPVSHLDPKHINLSLQVGGNEWTENLLGSRCPNVLIQSLMDSNYRGNENILEISYHLDNWMALRNGSKLEKAIQEVERSCDRDSHALSKSYCLAEDGNELKKEECDQIFELNSDLAKYGKLFELHNILDEPGQSSEHMLSFLGCGMEEVRSILAEHGDMQWVSNITSFVGKKLELSDFSSSLCEYFGRPCSGEPGMMLKMSFLNELQSQLWDKIDDLKKSLTEMGPEESKQCDDLIHNYCICLCLLSFPAITVSITQSEMSPRIDSIYENNDATWIFLNQFKKIPSGISEDEHQEANVTIRPVSGPQDYFLEVALIVPRKGKTNLKSQGQISIRKTSKNEKYYFYWEAWRNAFYGRLHGFKEWKKDFEESSTNMHQDFVYKSSVRAKRNEGAHYEPIPHYGNSYLVKIWPSWLPHNPDICKFELENQKHDNENEIVDAIPANELGGKVKIITEEEPKMPSMDKYDSLNIKIRSVYYAIDTFRKKENGLTTDRVDQRESQVRHLRKYAQDIESNKPKLSYLYSQVAALNFLDFESLVKCINYQTEKQNCGRKCTELVENFYKLSNERTILFGSQEYNRLKNLLESLLKQTNCDMSISQKYAQLTLKTDYRGLNDKRKECYYDARKALIRSFIVQSSNESIVSKSKEQISLILNSFNLLAVLLVNESVYGNLFSANYYRIVRSKVKSGSLDYNSYKELNNLAIMSAYGSKKYPGITKNTKFTKDLYEEATNLFGEIKLVPKQLGKNREFFEMSAKKGVEL